MPRLSAVLDHVHVLFEDLWLHLGRLNLLLGGSQLNFRLTTLDLCLVQGKRLWQGSSL